MKYYKGRFSPKNPSKYNGNPTNIIYRSLWELRVMKQFDENKGVISWSSEEIAIPYISPIDGKVHRYFPDFVIKTHEKKVKMIEIKPAAQSVPPTVRVNGQRITKKYLTEVSRYGINISKWKAADEYCKDRGWEFFVLTEKDLFQ